MILIIIYEVNVIGVCMKKILLSTMAPNQKFQQWGTLAFVCIIFSIAALGFIADGYQDSLNLKIIG